MSRSFQLPFSLLCVIALRASVNAQSAPAAPPPAHSHAPTPSGHPGGVVTLDQFVTTATPFARNQIDLAQSTTVLSGRSLLLKQQATLGETLSAETGMSATSFGPGASRPIIRGLGGDRIRILENSVGTIDASVTSPDHAVSVEPFLVERIEIVRGPASLLYGSNAVGGVVNVITHRIETDLPTERVRGGAEVRYGSAAEDFARGGVLDLSVPAGTEKAVVLHFDGFRRSTEDVRIPGFAESERIREEETEHAIEEGEPAPEFSQGRLPNSALDSTSAAGGISFVSKTFHVGASYSGFDSNYGVPGHAHDQSSGEADGVRIDLRQRRTDLQAEWHGEAGLLHGARLKFGQANYRHTEIEPDGGVGTTFSNEGYDARLELLHGNDKSWSGSLGVQSSRSDFSAIGEEAFLPPNQTRNDALFLFEELANGPLTWQFGGRAESVRVTPEAGGTRREELFSGAAGLVWKFDDTHALAVSLTHTSRMPNAQELYAYGAHAGTQSFEIGDANLAAEDCLGLELSLRRRQGAVTGALTLFANQFDNYIFEEATGQVAVEKDGSWVFPPAGRGGEDALPVYQFVQREAQFWGVEVETLWHLHDQSDWQLDLRLAGELTRAEEDAANLPRIPAARLTAGLVWANAAWSAGADCQWTLRQDRVAPNETPSDSYALVSAHLSHVIGFGRTKWELFLRGTNLANQEARPHTSFVKELAPLPGRSVTAGVRLTF